ncbi:MAG TPA: hypothetical protein VJY35_12805 [Candidatus Eisenbacteria bacterium]|nr:hypothetical protein [Candidatus Eisenbacteria bacterium]
MSWFTAPAESTASPGIVDGASLRLSGTHAFSFTGGSGTVTWSVDRETVSDLGVHTRTNGIATRTGPTASFSLPAVSGSETIYYINAANASATDVDTVQVFPANTKAWFTYRSAGNPDVRVYCVFPSSLGPATRVVLALHGNSRTASSYADDWRSWASQHDRIVLCPYYDLVNWPTTGHYQMGNVFAGDDCTGARNPEARWTFTIDEGIHRRVRDGCLLSDPRFDMWGFSGGGQHVHRFMVFKPNASVRIAIAAGSGWYTAPDLNIDCPYGLDDPLLSFTHADLMSWTNKTMIIMVGTADTIRDADLRVTPGAEAQGRNRYERAGYMYAMGRAVNPATRWQRIDVPGVAHEAEPMAQAAQAFLQSTTVAVPESPEVATAPAMLRVGPNPIAAGTVVRGDGWTNAGDVEIGVYDLAGRRIAAAAARASNGAWQVAWNDLARSGGIAVGVYLVRARDREHTAERKILVLK